MKRHRKLERWGLLLPCFALATAWPSLGLAAPPEDDGFSFEDDSEDESEGGDELIMQPVDTLEEDGGEGEGEGDELIMQPVDAPEGGEGDREGDSEGETLSEDSGFMFEDISDDQEALDAELKAGEVQASGEVGTISGTIQNAKREPLAGVYVRAAGTQYVARTGVDGRFELRLPPGNYTLLVELDLYKTKELPGLALIAGEALSEDVELVPMAGVMETFEVSDNLNLQAEGALQEKRKQQSSVSDGIDATEIGKSGGGKVSSVAVRIVGATVVDGRYLFVRGLGHRYGNTLLDGARVPSPEPELRTVPLDVFPTGALSAIDVQKSFSPDKPGDFTGGSVQFATRDAPDEATLDIGIDLGANTVTSWQPMVTNGAFEGYDLVGFGHIPRGLPGSYPAGVKVGRGATDPATFDPLYTPEQIQQQGVDLYTDYRVRRGARAPGNMGVKLTTGNSWKTNDNGGRFGVLFAGGYKNEHQTNHEIVRLFGLDTANNVLVTSPPSVDFESFKTVYTVSYNGILKLEYDVNSNNRFDLTGFYSHESTDETRDMYGIAPGAAGLDYLNYTRLRYITRSIAFTQLKGTHKIPRAANMQIEYFGSFSQARRDDPALREMVYRYNPDNDYWRVDNSTGAMGTQMYLDLVDNNENAALDLIFPFAQWKGLDGRVKLGAWVDAKQRGFSARRYYFTPAAGLADQVPIGRHNIINSSTIGGGLGAAQGGTRPFTLYEGTRPQDNYDAWQRVVAGYAMLDLPFVNWFKFSGGVRLESNVINVTPVDIYAIEGNMPDPSLARVEIVDLDWLPAGSLIFSPPLPEGSGDFNIRLSGSRTVARPEFRELAPFEFRDYVGGFDKQGNPNLRSTKIWNADLRFEWFPRTNEVVAISAFFKDFTDPIEEVAAARIPPKASFANAKGATNGGVEIEFRKALDFLAPKSASSAREVLRDLSLGANFAYIYSQVELYPKCYMPGTTPPSDPNTGEPLPGYVEREGCRPEYEVSTNLQRPLQGQSPWIVNAYLDYDNAEIGTNVRVLYNAFGPYIRQVSAFGIPDIYQQPRHMLDLVASQRLFAYRRNDWGDLRNQLLLTLEIENILNTVDLQTQTLAGTSYTAYRTLDGTTFKVGLVWKY
ncbi:MAG: carboxypeptidase regulatory-like domain-containing protein [Enhygromyxa sp.]